MEISNYNQGLCKAFYKLKDLSFSKNISSRAYSNNDYNDISFNIYSDWIENENIDGENNVNEVLRSSLDIDYGELILLVKEKENLSDELLNEILLFNNNFQYKTFEESISILEYNVSLLNLTNENNVFIRNYINSLKMGYEVFPEMYIKGKIVSSSRATGMSEDCAWATGALVLSGVSLASGNPIAAIGFMYASANWGRVCLDTEDYANK